MKQNVLINMFALYWGDTYRGEGRDGLDTSATALSSKSQASTTRGSDWASTWLRCTQCKG